jgi:hypothetical protein
MGFKGLINSYEDVVNQQAVDGIGEASVVLPSGSTSLDEMAMTFRYDFPQDYPYEKWRGVSMLALDLYKTVKGDSTSATYNDLRLYIPRDDLAALKGSGGNVMGLGELALVSLSTIDLLVRKDGVRMQKTCFGAIADTSVKESKFFVNSSKNTGFAAGENLKIWANVAMTSDKAKILETFKTLVDDNGSLCRYLKDQTSITKEEYYVEIKKEFDLDCGVPDGFLTPLAADYETFMFKGLINDISGNDQPVNGVSVYKVFAAGKARSVNDYSAYSSAVKYDSMDLVGVTSIGNVIQMDAINYTYLATETYFSREDLVALKTGGVNRMDFDGSNMLTAVYAMEQKDRKPKSYFRQCALAVIDTTRTGSAAYVCHEKNTDFSAGEGLQTAANFELTTDTAAIAEYVGTDDGCICYDEASAYFDCSEFAGK